MSPPVLKQSPPVASGWAAQRLRAPAPSVSEAESMAGSAGSDSRQAKWPQPPFSGWQAKVSGPPRRRSDSESSSQQESGSTARRNPRRRSRRARSQKRGGLFGPPMTGFAPPGVPTFVYPQPTRSPGSKSKTDVPIPVSPSQPPTGGTAKRQALAQGRSPSVRADDRRRAGELNLGRPPPTRVVMTPPMPTVLGHRSTEQTRRESCREIERGKRELKEDATTFASTEQAGNGTPIPYLVNPQSDTTPPAHARQTARRAVGWTRRTDFWGSDATLQQRPRATAAERRTRAFIQADGQCTVASSEASSHTYATAPTGFETTETLRKRALASIQKEDDAEEKEAEKKEDADEERMDQGAVPEPGQDKESADGKDKAGGSGTAG